MKNSRETKNQSLPVLSSMANVIPFSLDRVPPSGDEQAHLDLAFSKDTDASGNGSHFLRKA